MGDHLTYEESIKAVYKGLILLGVVTLLEVIVSLWGKGHLGHMPPGWLVMVIALIIIILSLYKAYFIIFEFMHMKYEVPGLARTVLLPMALLIWAIIAFFWEGADWNKRRTLIENKNSETSEESVKTLGQAEIYHLDENIF